MHNFRAFTPFREKSSDYKLLTNFHVNLTSLPGRVISNVSNIEYITVPWR